MNTANKPTLIAVAEGASPLDVLAARHRAAWDKTQHGRAEWIEGTLELAAVLAEEKRNLPDTTDFSRWLERNGLAKKPNEHDRAALIKMGKHLTIAREVLEKSERSSWRHIWEKEVQPQLGHVTKSQPATAKRKTKTERQIIEKVLNLHCERGYTYNEVAEELGLTKGQVAGIVTRNGNKNVPAASAPKPVREYKGLDSKTLTREQVDPHFKGTAVEFAAKYGHVLLHTKEQLEENKRQEDLSAWLAAISDLERAARALNGKAPDEKTLRQWLSKPGKAEKLSAWLTAIETAYRNIAPYLTFIQPQERP